LQQTNRPRHSTAIMKPLLVAMFVALVFAMLASIGDAAPPALFGRAMAGRAKRAQYARENFTEKGANMGYSMGAAVGAPMAAVGGGVGTGFELANRAMGN